MLMKPILTPAQQLLLQDRNFILIEAINVIRKRGWCRGSARNMLGNYCPVGALVHGDRVLQNMEREVYPLFQSSQAYRLALNAIRYVAGYKSTLPNWNDALPFWTGKKTVLAALEEAKSAPLDVTF